MDRCGALVLCLWLLTFPGGTTETSSEEIQSQMHKMDAVEQPAAAQQVHQLEQMLLNASFQGYNLTVQTPTIQALVFRLGCDFAGLSLGSATPEQVHQARPGYSMQFPTELTREACRSRPTRLRLICVYFLTSHFFQDGDSSALLNDHVVGAQLDGGHVHGLKEPVNISFWHNHSLEGYTVTCVFWKEGGGRRPWGTWSPDGCRTELPSPSLVLCQCDHLTYFAVLMQFSGARVPAELLAPLTYISLVGCSISVVASLLTVGLHFHARKQSDTTTCIHVNLHASVLLLNVAFLLSPALAGGPAPGAACTALAAGLHYALLTCLTWVAIEGFHLYLLLGRVYNVYIRRYVFKLCVLGWGLPALLVLLLLAAKNSVYGPQTIPIANNLGNGTGFQNVSMCWLRSPTVHSVLVMGYGGLMSLFNLVVLAWALRVLRRLRARDKARGPRACRDTILVLGLTVLLGTTWALAFFSFGVFLVPQLFLFTIFNSLYGFFLFLWFCSRRCRSEAEVKVPMEAPGSSQMVP